MKTIIHQPTFMPWAGLFHKILIADTFIFLENVQLSMGRNFGTRVKIKTPIGNQWLSASCKKTGYSNQWIRDAKLDDTTKWREKHLKTWHHCYSKAPYYESYKKLLDIYNAPIDKLADFNVIFILTVADALGIKCNFGRAAFETNLRGDDLLIEICRSTGADTYISGKGGANYQDEYKFTEAGIKLKYDNFVYPMHNQLWGDFIPNLSIMDLIFNCGPYAINFLK